METKDLVPVNELRTMAKAVVESRLFPDVRNEAQAFTLMLICQAENLHPIQAMQRYHIIQGRPAKKAEAMLADFQAAGGKVQWHDLGENGVASATFAHANGGSNKVTWTRDQAAKAGLTNNANWKKFEPAMLRARVISAGVRLTLPGVVSGFYTPEEVAYFNAPTGDSYPAARDNEPTEHDEPIEAVPVAEIADRTEVTRDTPEGVETHAGTTTNTIHERKQACRALIKQTDPSVDTLAKANAIVREYTNNEIKDFRSVSTAAQVALLEDAVGRWSQHQHDLEADTQRRHEAADLEG